MAFDTKIRPYAVVVLAWDLPGPPPPVEPVIVGPPDDAPIGLDAFGLANTFTILSGPADVAVRLNEKSNHLLEFIEGIDGVPVSEIFITSAEPTGVVEIYVSWEAQWE